MTSLTPIFEINASYEFAAPTRVSVAILKKDSRRASFEETLRPAWANAWIGQHVKRTASMSWRTARHTSLLILSPESDAGRRRRNNAAKERRMLSTITRIAQYCATNASCEHSSRFAGRPPDGESNLWRGFPAAGTLFPPPAGCKSVTVALASRRQLDSTQGRWCLE